MEGSNGLLWSKEPTVDNHDGVDEEEENGEKGREYSHVHQQETSKNSLIELEY